MDFVPPVTPPAVPPAGAAPVRYAGFWLRWVASLVDSFILSIPLCVLAMIAAVGGLLPSGQQDPSPVGILFFLFFLPFSFVLAWLYGALQESSAAQATFGKRLLGLRVTDDQGGRIGFGRATGRHYSKILSGIPFNLGFVMAAFTERKQALHDMIAKTLVVRR